MRGKVEYYNDRKITKEVLKKVNFIELKSIEEGITQFGMGYVKTLSELSNSHKTKAKNEHLILGEDWYISYTTKKNNEIEINDWISITKVENKFEQTIEMFNAIKKILITYKDSNIITTLRHSTSYPFYKKFLDEGYLEELIDEVDFDGITENDSDKIIIPDPKLLPGENTKEVFVEAIDGVRKKYIFHITRPEQPLIISGIKIFGNNDVEIPYEFKEDVTEYYIEIENEIDEITFKGETPSEYVVIEGGELRNDTIMNAIDYSKNRVRRNNISL